MAREETGGMLLKQVHDAIGKRLNNDLRESGLTNVQLGVLQVLAHTEGQQLRLKEIERIFHVSQPTVVGVADRLEEKGLIQTVPDPKDKRVRMVKLTEEGLLKCHHSRDVIETAEADMVRDFSEEEKALLISFLRRMRTNLQ